MRAVLLWDVLPLGKGIRVSLGIGCYFRTSCGFFVCIMEARENRGKQAMSQQVGRKPVFRLYVSGATPKSTQAITNLKPVLDGLYKEGYDLRVIDVYQNPPAETDRIFQVPVLVREYPLPIRQIGSDFSSPENVRRMLGEGVIKEPVNE